MENEQQYYDLIGSFRYNKDKPFIIYLKMYKGMYRYLFMSIVVFFIKHSPVWVVPIVTANIINIVENPETRNFSGVWINLIVGAVFVLQNVFTNVMYSKFFSKATRDVETRIRGALVRKLQQLSISHHKDIQTGKIQSKVLRDVESIMMLAQHLFSGVLPIILNTVVALTVTITKSLLVTVFFILTVPAAGIIVYAFRKPMRIRNSDYRQDVEKMSAKLTEMVEMIPVTRAHALEETAIDDSDKQLKKVKLRGLKLDVLNAKFSASAWVTMQIFQLACLAFSGWMAYSGRIKVGDVFLFQTYFSMVMAQVIAIINIFPILTKGFESIGSISEILDAGDIEDYSGKRKVDKLKGDIKFENVYFNYENSEKNVLNGFDLEVKPGQCVAFVGESGAGKSTIINMVIGFCRPTKGKMLIDGTDSAELDMRSVRENIAVVSQTPILFAGSIRENITYGLADFTNEQLWKAVDDANLWETVGKMPEGLETIIGEHGEKLSGGQRQRITIARALIRNPKIIILDEATSSLDNTSEKHVQEAVKNAAEGRTMLVVAHRLSTIKDADIIAFIKDGACAEMGTYDELMAKKGEFFKIQNI